MDDIKSKGSAGSALSALEGLRRFVGRALKPALRARLETRTILHGAPWIIATMVIGLLLLLAACAPPAPAPASPVAQPTATLLVQPTVTPLSDPAALATSAVEALRDRDMARLAALAHPTRGVRFSPYAFVRETDVVLTSAQLATALDDPTVYLWGAYDGSGAPISLTFAAYYEQFVYSHDFAAAPQVGYNQIIGRGNTINNCFEFYPGAFVAEYHFPGFNPAYGGMDWVSLRLVFQQENGVWYLVGIIHDQWTI